VIGRFGVAAALGAVLAACLPLRAHAQQDGLAVLEAAAARYGAASSVCADFVQLRSVPLLRQEVTQRGRLCSADPNLFAMRFTDPEGNVIVSDGSVQWIYRPSDNPGQVFRGEIGPNTGGQDFYREVLENPADKYDVTCASTEDLAGRTMRRVCLRAKGAARDRPDVVWIDPATSVIRQLHFREENGSERTITLSNVVFDVPPPQGWFSFTPPSGAIIIQM
jgi:outer membrane lipoprotein-sorting protein